AHAACASRAAAQADPTSAGAPWGTSARTAPVEGASTGVVGQPGATAARAARRASIAALTLGDHWSCWTAATRPAWAFGIGTSISPSRFRRPRSALPGPFVVVHASAGALDELLEGRLVSRRPVG